MTDIPDRHCIIDVFGFENTDTISDEIYAAFSEYGQVLDVQMYTPKSRKDHALVIFSTMESAALAARDRLHTVGVFNYVHASIAPPPSILKLYYRKPSSTRHGASSIPNDFLTRRPIVDNTSSNHWPPALRLTSGPSSPVPFNLSPAGPKYCASSDVLDNSSDMQFSLPSSHTGLETYSKNGDLGSSARLPSPMAHSRHSSRAPSPTPTTRRSTFTPPPSLPVGEGTESSGSELVPWATVDRALARLAEVKRKLLEDQLKQPENPPAALNTPVLPEHNPWVEDVASAPPEPPAIPNGASETTTMTLPKSEADELRRKLAQSEQEREKMQTAMEQNRKRRREAEEAEVRVRRRLEQTQKDALRSEDLATRLQEELDTTRDELKRERSALAQEKTLRTLVEKERAQKASDMNRMRNEVAAKASARNQAQKQLEELREEMRNKEAVLPAMLAAYRRLDEIITKSGS